MKPLRLKRLFHFTCIIMRIFTYVLALVLFTTSCVSKKKYAALEAQIEQQQSAQAAVQAIKAAKAAESDAQESIITDLNQQLEDMHRMVEELNEQMRSANLPPPTPEQIQQREQQRLLEHEMEMVKMNEENDQSATNRVLTKNENTMRLTYQAAQGALSAYSEPQVVIERVNSRLIITLKDESVLSDGKSELSVPGETLINRLVPILSVAEGLELAIVGITDTKTEEGRQKAAQKAGAIANRLRKEAAFSELKTITATQHCSEAYSGRKTGCDRVELVFSYNYDEVMSALRK